MYFSENQHEEHLDGKDVIMRNSSGLHDADSTDQSMDIPVLTAEQVEGINIS